MSSARKRVFDGDHWGWRERPLLEQRCLFPRWRVPKKREFLDGYPIYVSQEGKRFCISPTPRPGNSEVVFFTQREFDWIKAKKITPKEFTELWGYKLLNYRYTPITDEDLKKPAELARKYGPAIRSILLKSKGATIKE